MIHHRYFYPSEKIRLHADYTKNAGPNITFQDWMGQLFNWKAGFDEDRDWYVVIDGQYLDQEMIEVMLKIPS